MIVQFLGYRSFSLNSVPVSLYLGDNAEEGLRIVAETAGEFVRVGKQVNPATIPVTVPRAAEQQAEPKKKKK